MTLFAAHFLPVTWGDSELGSEHVAHVALATEADEGGDFSQGEVGIFEQGLGFIEAGFDHVVAHGLSGLDPKSPLEEAAGYPGCKRQTIVVQSAVSEVLVDQVNAEGNLGVFDCAGI